MVIKDTGKSMTANEMLVYELWWFIENVTDDTPDRTERFFALRERVREYGRRERERLEMAARRRAGRTTA
jgi:hypothetical protein